MADIEKILKGLDCEEYIKCGECPYVKFGKCNVLLIRDVRELLKEQEHKDRMFHALEDDWKELLKEHKEERKRMLSWLSKFCRHIDNGDKWLTDEENLEFFREKMKQQFGWFAD